MIKGSSEQYRKFDMKKWWRIKKVETLLENA